MLRAPARARSSKWDYRNSRVAKPLYLHLLAAGSAVAAAGVIAPLLSAWGILSAGPRWTFAAVGLVQAISAVPLLGAPNIAVNKKAPARCAQPARA